VVLARALDRADGTSTATGTAGAKRAARGVRAKWAAANARRCLPGPERAQECTLGITARGLGRCGSQRGGLTRNCGQFRAKTGRPRAGKAIVQGINIMAIQLCDLAPRRQRASRRNIRAVRCYARCQRLKNRGHATPDQSANPDPATAIAKTAQCRFRPCETHPHERSAGDKRSGLFWQAPPLHQRKDRRAHHHDQAEESQAAFDQGQEGGFLFHPAGRKIGGPHPVNAVMRPFSKPRQCCASGQQPARAAAFRWLLSWDY